MHPGFSAFQRRLVHQLVRAEFPDLVAVGQPGFIQIKVVNKAQEERIMKARLESFQARLHKQVGVRYFIEAMVGGDLKSIDPAVFVQNVNGRVVWFDKRKVNEDFAALRTRILNHRTVLVGHNLFMDLVYLYACFLGPLPNDVRDFQKHIHELFPMVVDTKYLATHLNNSIDVRSALEELDSDLANTFVPAFGKLDVYYYFEISSISSIVHYFYIISWGIYKVFISILYMSISIS